ncbi:short-chain dehydrogenase [Pelagivirga sediminicola]|uniref:Short-chain dehydrogenase n=1 Tax=Pelagivirga sediminicola TaxID=2170575 RepID=A0A2T7G8F9_9RHOB|nr:NnrS family protein [Pelagivirga sediminicola]PVA10686.1 short-chain dehydrogenase [Pelagivirga sediminicola]
MTTRTAEQMRRWQGPALLSFGFRPFFLGGAVWAALAMVLWILMLTGAVAFEPRFDPVSWHAHEFLFGTLGAIIAGFLLTAVPNWTGRLPVTGWWLGALALLWLAGRAAVTLPGDMPRSVVAAVDVAFPIALGAVILREIVAGKNWRNLPVLILLAVFALANALFHIDAAAGRFAAQGIGLRLGLAAAILMIALIGGRVVPSFTRNWLAAQGDPARPAPPMQRYDKATLVVTIAALLLWVAVPAGAATGVALLVVAAAHFGRLARWYGWRTAAEPLVTVLHLGYAFVPLGAAALGIGVLWPDLLPIAGAQHLWMAGAIGLMTLAVMTRATLGHTGRALHAGPGTVAIYAAVILSVLARLAEDMWPGLPLLELAALCWIGAFGGYAVLYGPMLLIAKPGKAR